MFFSLDGHGAIVTGAARGIGFAIARRLALAGAGVVIADMDGASADRSAESLGSEGLWARGIRSDVTSPQDAEAMVRLAL